MNRAQRTTLAFAAVMAASCGQKDDRATPTANAGEQAGLLRTDQGWALRTPELSVEPGEERSLCFTRSAEEDMQVSRFGFSAVPGLHHFMLIEAASPRPEGLTECNLFEVPGETLFTAATASVALETPAGSAKFIAKGTTLILQTHLANPTLERIDAVVDIQMTKSTVEDPEPVGILGFGSANIVLPPHQVTTVEATCQLEEEARFYAIAAHMHYFGRRVELAFGPDETSLETVYVRDPYSYDDQRFERFERTVPAGAFARVRCVYENDTEQTVRFGQSSKDEMCNVPGFIVGRAGVKLCTQRLDVDGGVPRDPNAGICGLTVEPSGIGTVCSPGGGECASGLACSADHLDMPVGICVRVGCLSNDDCDGATCCAVPGVAGLANFCVNEACRPEECIPVSRPSGP